MSTIPTRPTLVGLLLLVSCGTVEEIRDYFADAVTPHERYVASLRTAGLDGTALVSDWLGAAGSALVAPVAVEVPYAEDGFLAADQPSAFAYRIAARRGQRVRIAASIPAHPDALIFVDVYEVPRDSLDPLRHVAFADSGMNALDFEPRRDAAYVVRVQPEVLRGGRYTITLDAEPLLAFPVHGRSAPDIGSVFGDPRDGGARDHHGIDIFAPRGTPAIAAIEAVVTRVQTTPRGGNVVWLRDSRRGFSLYYAHLDAQYVTQGTRVQIGDTVGFVGNTGNARTTPPHLHFGVYQRGPVDPYPFVYHPRGRMPRLAVDTLLFGRWTRVARDGVPIRATAAAGAPLIAELSRHTPMRVLAGTGAWYRVQLPDGRSGFVEGALAEPADQPITATRLAGATPIHAEPTRAAVLVDRLDADTTVDVLGRYGEFLFVQSPAGPRGWVAER